MIVRIQVNHNEKLTYSVPECAKLLGLSRASAYEAVLSVVTI